MTSCSHVRARASCHKSSLFRFVCKFLNFISLPSILHGLYCLSLPHWKFSETLSGYANNWQGLLFYFMSRYSNIMFLHSPSPNLTSLHKLHRLFSTSLFKTKSYFCSSFSVKKFKRRMTHDTLYLHHKINQYFGTHLSLSAYIIPKSAKPHKQKLLKAISTENFTLPHIPPELRWPDEYF